MPLREVFTLSDEDYARLTSDEDTEVKTVRLWRVLCHERSLDYDTLKVWSDHGRIKFSAESLPTSHV